MTAACEACLCRTWLLAELAGHLDRVRSDISAVLTLADGELIAAIGGRRRARLARPRLDIDLDEIRRTAAAEGLELVCRCDPGYPARLLELPSPPAVLHVAGGVERLLAVAGSEPVAIVGTRRASAYGLAAAGMLARGLARAGVPVVSGLASGIDAAAHRAALSVDTTPLSGAVPPPSTLAVLPGSAHDPYPREARGLYRQLLKLGAGISEVPPGVSVRRWMFLARNRIIAGLAALTIVIEAAPASGALLTARYAQELGRPVGAVPGRITTPQAAGSNALINHGARLVTGPQDVLDLLFGAGSRTASAEDRPPLTGDLQTLLGAIEEGHDTPAALHRRGILAEDGLAALASLELAGYVRRGAGGRFTVMP